MNKEHLAKLKHKTETYRGWKQGWVTWEEYRDTVQARDEVRQAKTQLELNLVRDVKGSKKGFSKYIADERKTRENTGPLLKETRDLVTQDMGKAEVLNAFFALVFTSTTGLQESQVPETKGKIWSKADVPLVEEHQVGEYLSKLDLQKSIGPDGMHPKVLRELGLFILEKRGLGGSH